MTNANAITNLHVQKLGHKIEEIRCRALENIISKLEHGYTSNCDGVNRELLTKLLNWFNFDEVPHIDKVLELIRHLISENVINLCAFDELRFRNELQLLRRRLDSSWHAKIDGIEEAAVRNLSKIDATSSNFRKYDSGAMRQPHSDFDTARGQNGDQGYKNHRNDAKILDNHQNDLETMSPLRNPLQIASESSQDDTLQFDSTLPSEPGTPVSKRTENSIRWLVMPWQPLVSSDRGVLLAVEEALTNQTDVNLIVHTCQLITNVMLQDFPAEVFLQRPSIVALFQCFLRNSQDPRIIPTVLKAMYKLTRGLRFRIHYYCDPCIANKRQKDLTRNLDSSLPSSGHSSEEGQDLDNIDESVLQLQQMLIPNYCIETLTNVLGLLGHPVDVLRPLQDIKSAMDLASEIIDLLTLSLLPSIWLCADELSLKIHEELKTLMKLTGNALEYLRSYSTVDHCRITYLHLLCITTKFLSSLVPLEVSDYILPSALKISLSVALMDAPIYLLHPGLNATLQEYARQFTSPDETECLKLFEEIKNIAKSLKSAVTILKTFEIQKISMKTVYLSKFSLNFHKNYSIINKYILILQTKYEDFNPDDAAMSSKLILGLLSNPNEEIRVKTYEEINFLVSAALGVEQVRGRFTWTSLTFLFDTNILTEIICHGVTDDNEKIRTRAEDILIFLLKGKLQMGQAGWEKFLHSLSPIFGLLQSLATSHSPLGQCISKMLDPDVYSDVNLSDLEVLKGNVRLLYTQDATIREEALFRIIYLLGMENNTEEKRPRLASLHGLPLSSLLILNHQVTFKKPEGTYDRSNLLSVLEMLKMKTVEPKVRKSALVQVSVIMTDSSLHKLFLAEKGLETILEIMELALTEKDFENYPDSVIPIIAILKMLVSTQNSIRHDLSMRIDVFRNILRSLFLFPNHESIKSDTAQLLFILLFNDYMISSEVSISLPHVLLTRLKVPFAVKTHWKSSIHRKIDNSIVHTSNPISLIFLRQLFAWEWCDCEKILYLPQEELGIPNIDDKLKIREPELATLKFTSIRFYVQQQLFNIHNSGSHQEVACALDFLWMYIKLTDVNKFEISTINFEDIPWEKSFERFLLAHPSNKEDCDLFVDVLNFFDIFVKITKNSKVVRWLSKTMRNTTRSLSDLLRSLDKNHQNVHQSVLKIVRSCTNLDECQEGNEESIDEFVGIIVENLCSNDQQHFYNLVYLDWLLTCLTYLTSDAKFKKISKNRVENLGNSLIELIVSFHANGAVSFMGLSITKNSIICLNHLLEQMEGKVSFFYDEGRVINWLPSLWLNRDPLVRASALQLLAGLIRAPHTAQQLLHGLALTPSDLIQTLIRFLVNREESSIVREEAAIALTYLIRNSNNPSFQYTDSLRPTAVLIYVEQANTFVEVTLMCSNLYLASTLDPTSSESTSESSRSSTSLPRSVLHYYNCHDELLMLSLKEDHQEPGFVTTPSLISAVCGLLNSLIIVGQDDVVSKMYENSLDKYFVSCFGPMPILTSKNKTQCYDVVQMYMSLCTVLTNAISHSAEFSASVKFSPDFLYLLFSYLKADDQQQELEIVYLKKKLSTEIFNLISILSMTENQHLEAIRSAIDVAGAEEMIKVIARGVCDGDDDLRMSAIACLTFLLSQEIQNQVEIKYGCVSLGAFLDSTVIPQKFSEVDKLQDVIADINKLMTKTSRKVSDEVQSETKASAGEVIFSVLEHLMIAYNYANSKKTKTSRDKDLIVGSLANLLCVSREAKRTAVEGNLGKTCLLILKEAYTEISLQPYQPHKTSSEREKKIHPMLNNITRILVLLMNFANDSLEVKKSLASAGIADMLHKLWAWISLSDSALIAGLKLMATVTTSCSEAAQSLTLTTTLPGAGPRRTPNTVSLLNVIIILASREIEKASQSFDNHRLHYAFHVIRNSVHVHECRVTISKSSLLQFFTRIHPATTKRNKPWPLIEIYCLEFLLDFTYYEEGQTNVPKATDAFEVLIQLARCSTANVRILALSVLRNLVFNVTNRPRILSSMDFMNLLHFTLKNGNLSEIGVVGSILWSLIANNQKAKLITRTAAFGQSLQEVLGRLSLDKTPDDAQHRDLAKIIQYVITLLKTSDAKSDVSAE